QLGLLRDQAHGIAGHQPGLAVADLIDPRHDPQQAGFTRAVGTDDADFGAGEEVQGHVVEDDLVAVRTTRLFERVNELSHSSILPDGLSRLKGWSKVVRSS